MINDFYGDMAVYKQQVAEFQAQAERDRLAKEFRAARKRQRAEQRTAARLEAAFEGTPRGPLATVRAWFRSAEHNQRSAGTELDTARLPEPGSVPEAADPHPAGIR